MIQAFFHRSALRLLAIAAALAASAVACSGEKSWRTQEFERRDLTREASVDVDLPVELWDKLDQIGREGAHGAAAAGSHGDAKPSAGGEHGGGGGGGGGGEHGGGGGHGGGPPGGARPTEFASIKVYLYPKAAGALAAGPTALDFGEGGGEVDFADYLTERRGSFYVAIELAEELKEEPFKAYFLSNAKSARIGAVRHGGGCGSYYDVTSYFKRAMKGAGFLVSAADFRHAYALGGTFFLGYVKDGALRVSQVTFRDSRAPEAECRARRQ